MRPFPAPLLPVLLLACTPGCATVAPDTSPPPQEAAYARTPGDTLRYRKRSEWSVSYGLAGMRQSRGSRNRRDARFAITFTADGRAHAWLEQTAGADGGGLPVVVAMGPRGIDSIVSEPRFPPASPGLEDQLDGFFPRLPGGPLTPGREWIDSGTDEVEDRRYVTRNSRYITYRVTGTGRIRGTAVVVVRYDAIFKSEEQRRTIPTGINPYLLYSLSGGSHTQTEEQGTLYFAPRPGRLVRRTSTGESTFSRPSGYAEAIVQDTRYRVTVDLVSSPRD